MCLKLCVTLRCYVDLSNPIGPLFNIIVSAMLVATFATNFICYVAIFLKMRAVELKLLQGATGQRVTSADGGAGAGGSNSTKYHSVARIMMLFVVVFMVQYWAFCVYCMWFLVEEPPVVITWAVVFFPNLGGMLNLMAYTVMRRRLQAVKREVGGAGAQSKF